MTEKLFVGQTQRRVDTQPDGSHYELVKLCADASYSAGPQSAANIDLLTGAVSGWFDVGSFSSVSFQIIGSVGITAGAVIFEHTNDPVNAPNGNTMPVMRLVDANPGMVTTLNVTSGLVLTLQAPVVSRYVRVRILNAMVGGTVRCAATFSQAPFNTIFSVPFTSGAGWPQMSAYAALQSSTTGATSGTLVSAATNNLTQLKGGAGRLYKLQASNTTAVWQFVKMFDALQANVAMGTTLAVRNLAVPPGKNMEWSLADIGDAFANGITLAVTTGMALNDNTPTTANSVSLNYLVC